jgi:phosphatidylinositol alpha-mannosyltransferase
LAKYYEASDIVIYPTLGKTFESFGMVIIEAMAAGKPVIASNVPGVRAVLDDKINGYLTQPKNVAELSSKIRLLLDNESLRYNMGHNGRVKAQKKYSWPLIVKKLEEIYEDCVCNL